jgi:AhpD family alkylhydroperoxidase
MNKKSRLFTVKEHVKNIFTAGISFVELKKMKKKKIINKKLKERVMLAVSEVNGCAMCSWVHTRIALDAGMDNKEIKTILAGEMEGIPEEDVLAVLFAKNFAFNHDKIDPEMYQKLIDVYGENKAIAIVYVCNVITMTCAMGINLKLLRDRILFKRRKDSNLLVELTIPLLTMILFPFAVIKALFRK